VAVLGAGCRIAPPPVSVYADVGIARAHDEPSARRVAAWMNELVPAIRGAVPGTIDDEPDVWVQRRLRMDTFRRIPESVNGIAFSNHRILLRESDTHQRETLCHELVHHLLDEPWDTLPTVIEEGLCEKVAEQFGADDPVEFRARRLVAALHAFGGLSGSLSLHVRPGAAPEIVLGMPFQAEPREERGVTPAEALRLRGGYGDIASGKLNATHYALGYWLVDRIHERSGYGALYRLSERATSDGLEVVPIEPILDLAGVPADPESWRPYVLESFDGDEVLEFTRDVAPALAERVAIAIDERLRTGSRLRAGLAEVSVLLYLEHREAPLDLLAEVPEFGRRLSNELERRRRLDWRTDTVAGR